MIPEEVLDRIHPVSRETKERLLLLVEGLKEWQTKTNLVSPSTLDDIWNRHVADSLQCLPIKSDAKSYLDIGSGGGFPGLVIAAALAEEANSSMTMVESNQKKAAFLRQIVRKMGSNAQVLCKRVEQVTHSEPYPEVMTARALASLPMLLKWSEKWLSNGTTALFHKGREFREELALCDGLWRFDLVVHESQIEHGSVILEISNLEPV